MAATASSFGQWRTGAFGSEGKFTGAAQQGAHNIRLTSGFDSYGFAHYKPSHFSYNGNVWDWKAATSWENLRGYYYSTEAATLYPGIADEVDAALALGVARPVGLATETDTALALAGVVARPVGVAVETDTALGLGVARPVGLSAEADASLALGVARPAGLSTETDAALALTGVVARPVGVAAETDTSLALGVARPAGVSLETDSSLALSALQLLPVGLAAETDTALALPAASAGTPVGMAVETDTALALSPGAAVETVQYGGAWHRGQAQNARLRAERAAQLRKDNNNAIIALMNAIASGVLE